MRAKKTTSENQCVHHWLIDSENVGRCKKCSEVRDFGAMYKKVMSAVARSAEPIRSVLIRRG